MIIAIHLPIKTNELNPMQSRGCELIPQKTVNPFNQLICEFNVKMKSSVFVRGLVGLASMVVFGAASSPSLAEFKAVKTINGKNPPGAIKSLVNTKTLVDEIRPDGQRILAVRGTRLPGTRVPIHVHEFSGLTCIISGHITDFVEGEEDKVFGPGDCYYMPAATPMSAVNLGKESAILIDIFVLPVGERPMKVIESGVNYP